MAFFDSRPTDLIAEIRRAGHHGVHNFSLGTLTTYFRLESCEASIINGVLILDKLPGSAPRKVFVFRGATAPPWALQEYQQKSVVYSIDKLALMKGSRFKELAYDLAAVFDPASYPNARKRSKRLVQPGKRLTKHDIELRPLLPSDLPSVIELHSAWCDWKLAQPTTMRMMFPKRRYENCMKLAIARPSEYVTIGAFQAGKLLAARALYIEEDTAFDLANFSAAWDTYADFSEDFYIETLRLLHASGIKVVNCGSTMGKALGAFKGHWPSYGVESWAYGKL